MIEDKKGCVYFFKHTGLSPVKIGYTNNVSPINRFNQFKTYAPFGAEIIGFIQTEDAKEIETKLHKKYYTVRLDGEWFEISEKQIKTEIDFYTSKEDIKLRNDFQIAWAKELNRDNETIKNIRNAHKDRYGNKKTNKEIVKDLYLKRISVKDIAEQLNISVQMVYKYIKKTNKQ